MFKGSESDHGAFDAQRPTIEAASQTRRGKYQATARHPNGHVMQRTDMILLPDAFQNLLSNRAAFMCMMSFILDFAAWLLQKGLILSCCNC